MRYVGPRPPEWDALDADPPLFASGRWLDHLADRIEGSHQWFVRDPGTGAGVGFFGSIIAESSVSEAKNVWRLLFEPGGMRSLTQPAAARLADQRAAAPELASWFPSLVLLYPGLECFAAGPGGTVDSALDAAVAEVVAQARVAGVRSVAFLYVQPEDARLPGALRRAGFVEFPVATRANLRLPGDSFADYRSALSRDAQRELRRIRRRLAEQQVTVRRLAIGDLADELLENLVELRMQHRRKHGRRLDEAGERSVLSVFRESFGDRVTVYAAMVGSRIVGFGLFLDAGPVRHIWSNGTDYRDLRSRNTHFEVCYYAPIEDAYRTGAREISFSYGVERVKRERGCRLEAVTGFVLPLDQRDLPVAAACAAALRGDLTGTGAGGRS